MPMRAAHARRILGLGIFLWVWILSGALALAEEVPHPGLAVTVGLSGGSGAGAGISLDLELTAAEPDDPGTRAPIRMLRLSGPIGSLDLRGVPTCKPTTKSTETSGCTTPLVGRASGYAYENSSDPESGIALKQYGTFRLYSGGQQGDVSKLYLWASFPGVGGNADGRSLVIPFKYTKEGTGRSDLVASFPRTKEDLFDIALLRMSINRSINVGGRSIGLTKVRCPLGSAVEASANASFWGPRDPVDATPSLVCKQ
jgi:hypothetical protein